VTRVVLASVAAAVFALVGYVIFDEVSRGRPRMAVLYAALYLAMFVVGWAIREPRP